MGQILVRNLDDKVLQRLRQTARRRGQSLEQTVRQIITEAAKPLHTEIVAEIDELRNQIGPVSGDSTALIREDRDNDEPYR